MKTETKHTPGPWRVNQQKQGKLGDDFDKLPAYPIIQSDFRSVGRITNGPEVVIAKLETHGTAINCAGSFHYTITPQVAVANARLMAAAPELLCWLENAINYMERYCVTDTCRPVGFEESKAAIAKARGQIEEAQ